MAKNIVIMGRGAIGQAIAKLLRQNPAPKKIYFWDRDSTKITKPIPVAKMISAADFLFLCLPSSATRQAVKKIKPYLTKRTVVITVAKGLERKSKKFMNQLLELLLPADQEFVLLYGPMLANEIQRNKGAVGVVATKNKKVAEKIKALFRNSNLLIEHCADVQGVAALGVLKNVYALGLGMANGVKLESNMKAWLCAKTINEMSELTPLLGGKKQTTLTTAGVADLLATGFSPTSHNYNVGYNLITTKSCPLDSEGCLSLPPLVKLLGKKINRFALLQTIKEIVLERKSARLTFEKLLKGKKD